MPQLAHAHQATQPTFEEILDFEEISGGKEVVAEAAAGETIVGIEAVMSIENFGTGEMIGVHHSIFARNKEIETGGLVVNHTGAVAHHRPRVEDVRRTTDHEMFAMHFRVWRLTVHAEVRATGHFLGAHLLRI